MNSQPLLTIITVTFNAARYLPRTLESVRKAVSGLPDPARIEYLIIDGKSADDTLAIAAAYPDLITKVVSERDSGLYDAMNKGQLLAQGKYLWFLNAGDEVAGDSIILQLLAALESNADVYYSDALLVTEDGRAVGLRSKYTPHDLPEELKWQDFGLGMKVCHQAFIAKKNVAPPYDTANLSADIDWEIQCLKSASRVEMLPFVLCRYLLGGLSVKNHRRSLLDRFSVLRKHFGLVPAVFNHMQIFWRGLFFAKRNGKYW